MEHVLENDVIRVTVSDDGAQLISVWDKERNTERIWCGDAKVWGRHAPILFPFVGSVSGGHYLCEGKEYAMTSHGFARDRRFEVVSSDNLSVVHVLRADENTRAVYPFDFALYVRHSLSTGSDRSVNVEWKVVNEGSSTMLYSIGGHPAFNFPKGEKATDCAIRVSDTESLSYRLLKGGLIDMSQNYELNLENGIASITAEMFNRDALIVMDGQIESIELLDAERQPYVRLNCKGFPYFGIWSKPSEEFLCLEPWYGVADVCGFNGELADKLGEQSLKGGESREYRYTMELL